MALSSDAEFDFILAELPFMRFLTSTGGHDRGFEGVCVWSNGEPGSYTPWALNEPTGANGEDCVITSGDGTIEDASCGTARDYICERTPAGT